MANQNDNDFLDDDLDGDLSSQSHSVINVSDDVRGDISDYDDNEDGIFAPAPQKKKAGSSTLLLGTVAVLALLGGGGYYAYNHTDFLSSLKTIGTGTIEVTSSEAAPAVAVAEQAPADAPPAEAAPVAAEAAAVELPSDPELAAIPQPQPIENVPQDAAAAPAASEPSPEPAPVPEAAASPDAVAAAEPAPAQPDAAPDTAPDTAIVAPVPDATAPAPEVASTPAEMPAPPSPEETKAEIAKVEEPVAPSAEVQPEAKTEGVEPKPEVVAAAPSPEVKSEPPVVASGEPVTPVPAQTELAPAPKPEVSADASSGLPTADEGVSVATGMTKSSSANSADTYFDSPGARALNSIPTPSMDASRGNGESIIVVHDSKKAAPKKAPAVKKTTPNKTGEPIITASSQEAAIQAAGRALRLGRYEAAYDMYSDLYRANPRDGRILMGRAVALQKLGRSGEAVSAYEEVLYIDPDNTDAIVNLAGLIRKESPAIALEKLLSMKQRYPGNAAILAQLGVAYADSGNLEDAASSLQGAVRLEPKNPQHYFNLAVVAERMKNRPGAIAFYEKALEIDSVYGTGRAINRDMIYDRLARLRG